MLPNSTDLVISRQLGTIINTSYYVKLHLQRVSAPGWTIPALRLHRARGITYRKLRLPARCLLGPFSAHTFNAVVLQNKMASKNTEIKKVGAGGEVNKSAAAQRKNNFALVF